MDEQTIGQTIRSLREESGLSLAEVASRAGLSKSALSKIEKAQVSSPISTLLAVAGALNVHLSRFFTEPESKPRFVVTRAGKAPVISRGGSQYGYSYRALAAEMPDKIGEPFLLTVRPGDKRGVFRHDGQEFIFILSGRMRMRLAEDEVVLEEGDALYFDPSLEHTCEALDRRAVHFLCCFLRNPNS